MKSVTLIDVLYAHRRLSNYLLPTRLEEAPRLGDNIYFKLENLNETHSFKVRGALNAILRLSDEDKERGIVACSAGNHAQGIAYAAAQVGITAQVVMPVQTPKRKVDGARKYGAKITLYGDDYDEAEQHAFKLRDQIGMTFISPYNDPMVVAGQGTIGWELFDMLPGVQRVIVPVSGGGLIAGIGLVCKAFNPDCEVIGVQSEATPEMYNVYYGESRAHSPTIAEGLAGGIETGAITIDLCKRFVDQMILVSEDDIKESIRWMLKRHNWIIEGAAAVGIAAMRTGKIEADGRQTVIIVSGGNLDYEMLQVLINA